ncbi:MAG: DUF4838 domain-containing protein [Phycisphaerae bacterium]|nr:DUF4838 domain-containing protein [Phycisphaerae bacterium]
MLMRCLLSVSVSLFAVTSIAAAAMPIAENGEPQAIVVVAKDATEAEQYAARELAEVLPQITGATFEITGVTTSAAGRLLVGPDAARLAAADFSTDELGEEGLIIRTVGTDLILAGGRPRGTLYAVYTFLQDTLGCRWWTPDVATIPHKPTLTIPELNIRFVPKLEYREPYWFTAFDADWAARNRCNGARPPLADKHGGRIQYEGFVHTFYGLIPPDRYFEAHPEWFSEIDGQRKHEHAQLCLTNEAMRAELVRNLKARLRKNPQARIASVSQNDWHGNCQCSRCAAVDAEEGGPSGSLLRFVNAVAAEIEPEFPHVAISTLAYQYTRKPPKHVRARPNVIVRLCSIECSFSKPLEDERNAAFRDDIKGWSKMCERLYIWDYTTNFAHYILPHPNLRVLGPNIRFFVEHNVKGIFEQGAYQSPGSEMMELRAWVLARLLWDPSLDANALIDEFLDGYYGPAAPHIRAYLAGIHDAVDTSGDPLGCYSPTDAKFLSLATLSAGWAHLQAAEAAAADKPELLARVQVAQLPVLYAFLREWPRLRAEAKAAEAPWPVTRPKAALFEQWAAIANAAKVTQVREHGGTDVEWLRKELGLAGQ